MWGQRICLSVCLSVCLLVGRSVGLLVCRSVGLSVRRSPGTKASMLAMSYAPPFETYNFCNFILANKMEASYFDQINMSENGLENDRKKFTPTNVNVGTLRKDYTNEP